MSPFGFVTLDSLAAGHWPPFGFDVIDVINEGRVIAMRCTGCHQAWLMGPQALASGLCWQCRTNAGKETET